MRDELALLAQKTLDACFAQKLKIVTAESCTGGLLAGALTENAGSSLVFERGFVTYSNEAKQDWCLNAAS
jgi:nicotinamide-nucleotide amidase